MPFFPNITYSLMWYRIKCIENRIHIYIYIFTLIPELDLSLSLSFSLPRSLLYGYSVLLFFFVPPNTERCDKNYHFKMRVQNVCFGPHHGILLLLLLFLIIFFAWLRYI